jgi:hypothetical protein
VPPRGAVMVRDRAPDRGMQVLEQKLSILSQGPSRTRRNPALDVLTGRVPDERLQTLQAHLQSVRAAGAAAPTSAPSAMVLPIAAIKMAAVARSNHPAPTPWLRPAEVEQPRFRLVTPPPSRWSRVRWIGRLVLCFMAERRPCTYSGHSPRAHLAS